MKRILFAGVALAAFGGANVAVAEPLPLGWFGSFEGSYARTFEQDGTPAVTGQQGNVLDGKSKHGLGLGVNLGYRFRGGWDFGVGVSGLVGFDKDTSFAGAYAPVAGTNSTFGPIGGEVSQSTNYFALDFTAGYDLGLGMELPENTTARVFGGVRVANFRQSQEVSSNAPFDFNNENKSNFIGAGPRLGVEGQYGLGGGFSLFGGVSGSILMGQISRELTSSYAGTSFSNEREKYRTVYEAQGELGLGYSLAGVGAEGATIQVGYRADYWWNATDNTSGVAAFDAQTGGAKKGDVGFHGPFMRVNFQF